VLNITYIIVTFFHLSIVSSLVYTVVKGVSEGLLILRTEDDELRATELPQYLLSLSNIALAAA
jgi:hypothetical protein